MAPGRRGLRADRLVGASWRRSRGIPIETLHGDVFQQRADHAALRG